MPASPSLGPGEPGLLPRQAAASALVPMGLRVSPRCWVERGRPPSSRGSGLLRRGRLCHSRCGSAAVSSIRLCPPCFLELCWAGHRGRPRHPQRFELQRGCEGPRVLPASPAWLSLSFLGVRGFLLLMASCLTHPGPPAGARRSAGSSWPPAPLSSPSGFCRRVHGQRPPLPRCVCRRCAWPFPHPDQVAHQRPGVLPPTPSPVCSGSGQRAAPSSRLVALPLRARALGRAPGMHSAWLGTGAGRS